MITIEVPVTARGQFTGNIFSAVFNANVLFPNRYHFDGLQKSTIVPLLPRTVYVLDKIFFSANMPEGVYQEAIDDSIGLPQLILTSKSTEQGVLVRPYNFINYVDNQDNILFFRSDQMEDELLGSFKGLFSQPAEIVGLSTMKIFLQLTIFEVSTTSWVEFFEQSGVEQGQKLPLRGSIPRAKWEEIKAGL